MQSKAFQNIPQGTSLSHYIYLYSLVFLFLMCWFYFFFLECPVLFLPHVISSGKFSVSLHQMYYSFFWQFTTKSQPRNQTLGLPILTLTSTEWANNLPCHCLSFLIYKLAYHLPHTVTVRIKSMYVKVHSSK